MKPVVPAWARDFDNRRRHCYQGKNPDTGEPRRWLNGKFDQTCTEDHDPKLTGDVEWLRFIRRFGKDDSPFHPSDQPGPNDPRYFLLNETDGHTTSDGRRAYSETYLVQKGDSWGLDPVFRVFLANAEGWARIECYDEELVGRCELALAAVEASYAEQILPHIKNAPADDPNA